MVTDAIIERLRWHAGLHETAAEDIPSIASTTWPRGRGANDLQEALADCLNTLATLNLELNGEVPSAGAVRARDVPRSLAYAMTEIIRMIRECHDQAPDQQDAAIFARVAWRVETAWSAVLAGDIDEILKHVEQEEAARFE